MSVRPAVMHMDPLEANELAQVVRRLIAELGPVVRPEEVQRCVYDVVARFDAATIRKYVPCSSNGSRETGYGPPCPTPTPVEFDQIDRYAPAT
jgi:hypothetical protein